MVDLSTLESQALPLEDWYSFTIALPEGLDPGGARSLEVVPKKRYDAVVQELSETTVNIGMHWMSRDLKTDDYHAVRKMLFVRCANGYITSGYYSNAVWCVFDLISGAYVPENPDNPVTHYCHQPAIQPWNCK